MYLKFLNTSKVNKKMSDPQSNEPLIAASGQAAIKVGPPAASSNGSSSRAYKVAGLTVLACLLIAGQALTVYVVLNQRNDIKALEQKHKEMKDDLKNAVRVAAVPVKMQVPMSNFPRLTNFLDEGESSAAPNGGFSGHTKCQLEAAGLKQREQRWPSPKFHPSCDEQGRYLAQQCWMRQCWCVEPETGAVVHDSVRNGRGHCAGASGDGLSVGLDLMEALQPMPMAEA